MAHVVYKALDKTIISQVIQNTSGHNLDFSVFEPHSNHYLTVFPVCPTQKHFHPSGKFHVNTNIPAEEIDPFRVSNSIFHVLQHSYSFLCILRGRFPTVLPLKLSSVPGPPLTPSTCSLADHLHQGRGEIAHSVISCSVVMDTTLPPAVCVLFQHLRSDK